MKHYVLHNEPENKANAFATVSERVQYVDVILHPNASRASAELALDFYRALNGLMEHQRYVVTLRALAEDKVGGPLYWAGRTAVIWGGLEENWNLAGAQKHWATQVLNLAPRVVLVGGAVMLLAQASGCDGHIAAIHPSFQAAASERGIRSCGASTYLSLNGRWHSANTRISALRLLAEFVSSDHGEHLADAARRYVGLEEPKQAVESQTANRLVRRSGGDELVILTLSTMLEHIEEPLSITDLSKAVGASTRQLQRRYLCKTGATLLHTYKELRIERAIDLLRQTDLSLVEIAAATGFSSRAAMSRALFEQCGSRPEDIRTRRYLGYAAG